jgi:hypothetical protein
MPSEPFSTEVSAMRDKSAMDDEMFQSLLEQVRDLHDRTDQLTRSKSRIHENIRARLSWNVAPSLPDDQWRLADEVVEVLGWPMVRDARSHSVISRR